MQDLMKDFYQKMCIKNYSENTRKSYSSELKRYLAYCAKEQLQIDSRSFQDYLYSLIQKKRLSESSLKQAIGAVKFFFAIPSTSLTA